MSKIAYKFLENVNNANNFYAVSELEIVQGNATTLYFRLYTLFGADSNNKIADLRYLPQVGATMEVEFNHIDTNQKITRVASQPYPTDDRSIWKVDILATDKISFDSMTVKLTEGANTQIIQGASKLKVSKTDNGKFYC